MKLVYGMKLDLASGACPADGYVGVDVRPFPDTILVDLADYPWPFPDNSCPALRSSHYVEHCADLVAFMNECHRILEPGGELRILCPYQHSDRAWQDPTHVRALNFQSWCYYDAEQRAGLGDGYAAITADFEIVETTALVNPSVAAEYGEAGIPPWLLLHGVNVIDDMHVVLRKR